MACVMGAMSDAGKRSAMLMQTTPWSACCSKPDCMCKLPVCKVRDKSMPPNSRSRSTLPGTLTVFKPKPIKALSHCSRTGPKGARNQMPPNPAGSICRSCNDVRASCQVSNSGASFDMASETSALCAFNSFCKCCDYAAKISCKLRLTRSPESVSSSGLRRRRCLRASGAMV